MCLSLTGRITGLRRPSVHPSVRSSVCDVFVFMISHVSFDGFLRATAVPAGTPRARISYGDSVCLSVRLSVWGVTTRYRIKHRSDRDSGFSPYDSLESLVSSEMFSVICDRGAL